MSLNFRVKTHPLYTTWCSMKSRCNNPNEISYKNYGGRGIKVCKEWNDSFEKFYLDMIEGYIKGIDIDRINNNGNYCKENCRWVTRSINCANRRTSIVHDGLCAKHKSLEIGGSSHLIKSRIKKGWNKEKAFNTPVKVYLNFNGESAAEASIRLGGGIRLVQKRINKLHWDIEEAFTTPVKNKK